MFISEFKHQALGIFKGKQAAAGRRSLGFDNALFCQISYSLAAGFSANVYDFKNPEIGDNLHVSNIHQNLQIS